MKNQAQIRAEEGPQNSPSHPHIAPQSPAREVPASDPYSSVPMINQPVEPVGIPENSSTPQGDTTPSKWNLAEDVQPSQREKRLSRLQKDALAACAIPFQKRRVKPPEHQKMDAVKSLHRAPARGSLESGKVQIQFTNQPRLLDVNEQEKSGLSLLRELDQQTTPQIKEEGVTPGTTPFKNEGGLTSGNCQAMFSPSFQGLPNQELSEDSFSLPRPKFTILTSPNHIVNSPFKVERYENALSMTTQERLEQLGKANYLQSQSLGRTLTPGARQSSSQSKLNLTSESPPPFMQRFINYIARFQLQFNFDLGRNHYPCPELIDTGSPLLIKIPSGPAHSLNYRHNKSHRASVYDSPFKDYSHSNMNVGRWKQEEHHRFLEALRLYGREWKQVQQHVATRTSTQARSHAQKFLGKLEKRNITLQQFLDKYFERPDELEDDFFSGVEDNDMVYNRKKQFMEEKGQRKEQQQSPVSANPGTPKHSKSFKEIQINGFTIIPSQNQEFKSEIDTPKMGENLEAPVNQTGEKSMNSPNQGESKFERFSDAYEGDDQFESVTPPVQRSSERRSKRRKTRGRNVPDNKLILPTQQIPASNFQTYGYPNQNMPFMENQEQSLNPQYYNPYDNEPFKPTNLIPRKSAALEPPLNPYFPQQQWQPYPMQAPDFIPSPMVMPEQLKNKDTPAVSAIPPLGSFNSNIVPPPAPSAMNFQNFIQFGQSVLQDMPGSQENDNPMRNLQQFEPPSVLNQQSVAAMMFSQQLGRNQFGMYDLGGPMQEDFHQYGETPQSNFYFPQQNYGQFNQQYSFQNESMGDYSQNQASPRNRTNSMPDAPSNHESFLKRSGFGRPYDNSEDLGGSIAANEESIGPVKYSGNFEMNGGLSKFRGDMKQGDDQVIAKD